MWIERISLDDFLAFDEASVELAPGLNVILSPNEGGKSSLFRGIVTALYADSSSRSGEVKALARWGSARLFKLEMDLSIGGASYRLVRDFHSKNQAISRAGEKEPFARGKAVDEFLGERLAFPDQNLFLRVCGVRHEELGRVGEGSAIGEKIEEILGGGWGEVTPAKLRQTVEAKRKELLRGRDHPAHAENWGPVKRFMESVALAQRELERDEESTRRRGELLAAISRLDSTLNGLDSRLEILKARKEKALRYAENERKEKEARGKAEELRKRIERIKVLVADRETLAEEGERVPEALRRFDENSFEALRRALELETLLEREIESTSARKEKGAPLWRLIAASVLAVLGILGALLGEKLALIGLAAGVALIIWYLDGRRGASRGISAPERARELEELRTKRNAWSGGRSLDDSKKLLIDSMRRTRALRDVDSRLEEIAAERGVDSGELLRRLDGTYGKVALEARALGEESASLAPFKADANETVRLEREITLKEEEKARCAADIARKDKELGALERMDTSEIKERLESAKDLLGRAVRKVQVLDAIIETLDEARGRMSLFIAERLPPRAAGYLSRITDGRYGRLFIDPLTMEIGIVPAPGDLSAGSVTANLPERVDPGAVSQGTRDQIYLAVRLALVDLLSGSDPQPLFLDDPFVHFDPERRARSLELVGEFARTHQVVIFTCDPYYRSLDARLVELPSRAH